MSNSILFPHCAPRKTRHTRKSILATLNSYRFDSEYVNAYAQENGFYQISDVRDLRRPINELKILMGHNLDEWLQSHGKRTGTPASINEFLVLHNAKILEILNTIEGEISKKEYRCSDRVLETITNACLSMEKLWTLYRY